MEDHSVLIIEDRVEIAKRLRAAVDATDGIEVVGVAGTLEYGLALLDELRPRVVLVDLGLPDGSGMDAVRKASEADWTIDTLVISIFGDEARVIEAIQAGARGYILKSGDLRQIGADIHSLLAGGSPISPSIARHVLNMLTTGASSARHAPPEPSPLTKREIEILRAVIRGYSRKEICEALNIAPGTVGNHITSIYRKLKVSSNVQAVAKAAQMGVL